MRTALAEPRLTTSALSLRYDDRLVVPDLDLELPTGDFTVIVGPNACGKSTTLRALARIMRPDGGAVLLDGTSIKNIPTKELARTLGLLPQSPVAPETVTVRDLVGRGRYPHQSFLRQWSDSDERAVRDAMDATGVTALADRLMEELSGGQRQRAWLAMVLAQEVPLLLLDEPTTFLDVTHQLDVLDLVAGLRDRGLTVVAVLHDLNLACRYADHLVCMRDGRVVDSGSPGDIVTADLVERVFDLPCRVIDDPETGTPLVIPARRRVKQPIAV
ncbi:ABC transporter ATP-binding protein [Flexivirga oryzae]|uniref:Iron complex transport system ATP-binding protein n=1 Tax=Flexivirga oryzae TaxID=1794944 RepID=A0A839N417_9MICO|nr:ABC transporter ATP-binding protein [Flexivirga oryzae]MBB2892478.1 iron complex transport system ATP-binding protein [Flexivirga oryzae]